MVEKENNNEMLWQIRKTEKRKKQTKKERKKEKKNK